MIEEACVYLITNSVNGKKYVGVTKNIKTRMNSHASHTIPTKAAIKNAIKKHGRENFTIEVIEEGSVDYCYEREPHWIAELNTLVPIGYNICTGGRGAKGLTGEKNGMFGRRGDAHPHFGKPGYRRGVPHSEETKAKMRAARLGRKHSDLVKAKISAASKSNFAKPEFVERMQKAGFGVGRFRKAVG